MALGTKNRLQQSADQCKQHLRDNHQDKLGLVNEFIGEFEGVGKTQDIKRWSQFADSRDVKAEMLNRLEENFSKWLNPG